ncbi:MAG: helix-turn-helix domain-containing protein [Candidatus Hydrogenedens sp.]|nr:helix-turn-helix domain-containing protein [Candidatus Hydrogenedens sp.]
MSDHEILTLEEVADYLRVSERTVYDWANKGDIPCGKIGTTWRFKRSEIERWVDQKLVQKPRNGRTENVTIRDVLLPEHVVLLSAERKADALEALVDIAASSPLAKHRDEILREVFAREALMSTGIGCGIGVPHVRLGGVRDLFMAVAINEHPLPDYEALDGEPVRIICLVAAREDQHALYLKTLAAISKTLKEDETRLALLNAANPAEAYKLLVKG